MTASNVTESCRCPVVVTRANSRHRRSAARWILVPSPPRERPSASRSATTAGSPQISYQPGEVVEFDTRTPHWIGNPGPTRAEVLAIFGPQGQRMHVRS